MGLRKYEGKTSADIHRENPDWQLFRDGAPGGESVAQVTARADRVVARIRAFKSDALLFPADISFACSAPAGAAWTRAWAKRCISARPRSAAVGYEHGPDSPVLRLWNDCRHVEG